jgi:hypothetical protein
LMHFLSRYIVILLTDALLLPMAEQKPHRQRKTTPKILLIPVKPTEAELNERYRIAGRAIARALQREQAARGAEL